MVDLNEVAEWLADHEPGEELWADESERPQRWLAALAAEVRANRPVIKAAKARIGELEASGAGLRKINAALSDRLIELEEVGIEDGCAYWTGSGEPVA